MFYLFLTDHNGTWMHGRLHSWQNGSMVVWIHGKMDPWQFGFMARWMNGSLDSWHYGCVAVWMHGIFENIPPTPPVAIQNQNTLYMLTLIYSKIPKTKN